MSEGPIGDSTDSVVDVASGLPAPGLRPYVGGYLGYRMEGFEAGIHRGLPSRHLTFIVSLDDPVDIAAMPDPSQSPAKLSAFVGGLHAGPALIRHEGLQHGIAIDLTALGTRALLGVPAGALASTVVDLGDLLGSRALELTERLRAQGSWTARFAVLDDVLTRALPDAVDPPDDLVHAWKLLVATGGGVEIGTVAREVGWSRRHLNTRFRNEVGVSPKVAARIIRFERACRLLGRTDRPDLATVAALCGYYDQAHLNRDWRELAGCSPTTWLAEELPAVSEGAPDDADARWLELGQHLDPAR
jgi:AraC-like DNA-binding protein